MGSDSHIILLMNIDGSWRKAETLSNPSDRMPINNQYVRNRDGQALLFSTTLELGTLGTLLARLSITEKLDGSPCCRRSHWHDHWFGEEHHTLSHHDVSGSTQLPAGFSCSGGWFGVLYLASKLNVCYWWKVEWNPVNRHACRDQPADL